MEVCFWIEVSNTRHNIEIINYKFKITFTGLHLQQCLQAERKQRVVECSKLLKFSSNIRYVNLENIQLHHGIEVQYYPVKPDLLKLDFSYVGQILTACI